MLEQLRNRSLDVIDLEEAVMLSAFARSLQAEYAQLQVAPPEWINTRTKELQREIKGNYIHDYNGRSFCARRWSVR